MGATPTPEEQAKARLAALAPSPEKVQQLQAAQKRAEEEMLRAKNDPNVIARNAEIREKNERETNQIITGTLSFLGGAFFMQSLNDPTNPGGGLLNNLLNVFGLGNEQKTPGLQMAGLKPNTPAPPSL